MNENINYEINVPKIIKSISKTNILERILYESILNSIHAEAKNINCYFNFKNNQLLSEDRYKEFESLIIEDNGVGFTENNLKSFKTYSTDYKTKKWGSKGTGRFSFLKCCKKVHYESEFKVDNRWEKKKINFNINGLSTKNLKPNEEKKTTLALEDFQISIDIENIEKIF